MQALVRHLHDFLRDVRLTEEEWAAGYRVPDRRRAHHRRPRQEFILLSDVLGASMQTITINNGPMATPPKQPFSAHSSSRAPPRSTSAATSLRRRR